MQEEIFSNKYKNLVETHKELEHKHNSLRKENKSLKKKLKNTNLNNQTEHRKKYADE